MIARAGAAAALVAACVVVVLLLLRAGSTYEITAHFVDGGQLVKGDQVHLGALPVGSVRAIRLSDDGTVAVRLRLKDSAAPVPTGTVARIRLDSLSGVANRYVTLDEPLGARRFVSDGGSLPLTSTQSPVDLDALVDTFDTPTRKGLQDVFRGSAQQYTGRAGEAKATLQRLAPALEGTGLFAEQFVRDRVGFLKLLRGGAVATEAIAARRSDLTDAIDKAQVATQALGDERAALADALRRLPPALAHGTRTFAAVRQTLDAVTPLVDAAKVSVARVPAFLGRVDALLVAGAGPLDRLATSVRRPGSDDDLIDLLARAPAVDRLTRTAFPRAIRTLDASRGQLSDLLAYTPDLVSGFSHLGQVTAGYDANGHYARVQPDLLAFVQDPGSNTLSLTPPGRALETIPTRQGARCPGAAVPPVPGEPRPVVRGCDPSAGDRTP